MYTEVSYMLFKNMEGEEHLVLYVSHIQLLYVEAQYLHIFISVQHFFFFFFFTIIYNV